MRTVQQKCFSQWYSVTDVCTLAHLCGLSTLRNRYKVQHMHVQTDPKFCPYFGIGCFVGSAVT